MNKLKEILKEGWDVYPPWLLVGHGLLITVSFLIILFVWLIVGYFIWSF